MKFVEIYKINNDGSQDILVRCTLKDREVEITGDDKFKEHLEKYGIVEYSRSGVKKLFPTDGLEFLAQLKYNFKSGYLNASDIKEEN